LLILIVAAAVLAAGWLVFHDSLQARWIAMRTSAVTQKPLSIYEWRDLSVLETPDYAASLAQLHKQGYRTIYVSLHGALTSPDPVAYSEQLARVSDRLHAAGFELAALAGDAAWVEPEHYPALDELFYFMADYNARAEHRIRQIALDIEPYTTAPQLGAADVSRQLTGVAAHLKDVKQTASLQDVGVGFVLPFWVCMPGDCTVGGLYDALAALGGKNFVSVMAYRNGAHGRDGSIALAEPFFKARDPQNGTLEIYVAQDTAPSEPAKVTFNSKTNSDLRRALYSLDRSLLPQSQYAGIVINDMKNLQELL
jgi:hypothetical protein